MPGASSCCPYASGQVCPAEDTSDGFCWILEIPASFQCEATLGESHYVVVLGLGSTTEPSGGTRAAATTTRQEGPRLGRVLPSYRL